MARTDRGSWMERLGALILALALIATSGLIPAASPAYAADAEASPAAEPAEEPDPTEEPTPEPTEEPEPTPGPTPAPEATEEPEPTPEPEPTEEPTPEPAGTGEPEPEPGASVAVDASLAPDASVQPEPSVVPEPTEEPERTEDPDATPAPTPEPTPEPTEPPPGEIVPELRTADSITYRAPDGSYVTDAYAGPVWYRPAVAEGEPEAEWTLIDPGFGEPREDGGLESDRAPVTVVARVSDHEEGFLALRAGDLRIRYLLPEGSAPGVLPVVREGGDFADYLDVLPGGGDLRVFPAGDGAKTFIMLDEVPVSNSWEFLVDAPGLTVTGAEDGSLAFVDAEGIVRGRVPTPFAVDSSTPSGLGSGRYSDDVRLSVEQRGGLQAIVITVGRDFLDDATYPVYIDPTTTDVPDDMGSFADTFVAQQYPNNNYTSYQRPDSPYYNEMWLGVSPTSPGYQNEVLIRFTGFLTNLADSRVQSAELWFRPYHQYQDSTWTYIRRATASWTHSTVDWNSKPGTTALVGDDPYKKKTSEGVTAKFDVADTVQAWIDGTVTNNGFHLREASGSKTYWKRLIAEEETGSNIPKLRVVWYKPFVNLLSPIGGASTSSRTLAWDYQDGWSGSTYHPQTQFEVQVATDAGFTAIVADSTVLNGSVVMTGPSESWTIPGSVTLTPSTTYHWRARGYDGKVWSEWSAATTFVAIAAPVLGDISAPAESGFAQGVVTISGTAAGASFTSYTLEYAADCTTPGTFAAIGTNPVTSPVTGGTLGTWDTTTLTLADGPYLVRLTVAYSTPVVVDRCVTLDSVSPTGTLAVSSLAGAGPLPITGTAADAAVDGLREYVVEFAAGTAPVGGWAVIDAENPTYVTPVLVEDEEAPLGTWDTTGLSGAYTVRLTVRDQAGNPDAVVSQVVYITGSTQGSDDGGSEAPFDLGGDWSAGVGVADGELSLTRTLFDIPSYGPAQSLTLNYASLETTDAGLFGTGWTSDLTQWVEPVGTDVVLWHTADGSILPFSLQGGDWLAPVGHYESLTHDSGAGTYTFANADDSGLVFEDSGDGRLLEVHDRFGQALTLDWIVSPATATDDSGRATEITISSGKVTSVEDSAGREWTFGYSSGRLATITDPEGDVTTFGYTSTLLTSIERDRQLSGSTNTIRWEFAFPSGRVETVTDPLGLANSPIRRNTFSYGSDDTVVTAPLDYAAGTFVDTAYTRDELGRVTDEQSPGEVTTASILDPDGNATTVTAADGSDVETVSTYAYDALGRLTSETTPGPNGDEVTTTYTYIGDTTNVDTVTRTEGIDVLDGTIDYDYNVDEELISEVVDEGGLDLETGYTYDANHQLEIQEAPDGTETWYDYDSHGNMVERVENYVNGGAVNAHQNVTTTYDHDAAGNVIEETDPLGRVTTYAYDDVGRRTRVTRNDVAGSSSDGDEDITDRTWYDAMGWVSATEDPRGTVTRHVTDRLGRVTRTIVHCTDAGTTPTSSPAACVSAAGTKDAKTNVWTETAYDARGLATMVTVLHPSNSALDVVTRHTYDDDGNLTKTVIDDEGSGQLEITTLYAYDDLGQEVAVKDPMGTTTRTFYDDAGNVTKVVVNCTTSGTTLPGDWAGCTGAGTQNGTYNLTTLHAYDDLGQQVTETAPNGRVTTTTYDGAGRVTLVRDNDVVSPSGNEDLETTYAYDDAGRTIGTRSPAATRTTARVSATEYDDLGRATRTIVNCTESGTTVPSTAECDGSGTANAETNIDTTMTYDAAGDLLSVTSPDPAAGTGSTATVTTHYAYDGAGRMCRVIEHFTDTSGTPTCTSSLTPTGSDENVSTRYIHDKAGNLVTAIDAAGQTQSYAFDRLGRMTSRTDGVAAVEEWQHDHRGNTTALVSRITTPSTSVTWAYDRGDRMTSRTADSATTTYSWDDNGNMLTAASATGTITATWDRLDRIKTVDPDDSAPDTVYTYDLAMGERDDPSGSGYDFDLDDWGRQVSMDTTYANGLTQTFRADGLPLRFTDSTGAITDRTYDAAGRLTGIATSDAACTAIGSSDCAVISYTLNRAGMRRTEASTIDGDPGNGTASFAYDHLGRLTGYDSPLGGTSDRDYAWDEVVSRTGVTSDPSGTPATVTTSFNAADRPTTDTGGGSYSNDADGRMTARPGQTLEWDSLGRLKKVRNSSTTAVISEYTYDALDRLRDVTSGGSTVRFRYVGLTTAVGTTYDTGTSTTTRRFSTTWDGTTHGNFTSTANSQVSYGRNGHGDVTWTSDDTGAMGRTYRYDPWGTIVASSGGGPTPHLRFQSSWRDSAVELYWVVTRWYAPVQARFISEDSLLGQLTNPDSRHRYAYAEGEPIGGWDPDGRATFDFSKKLPTTTCPGNMRSHENYMKLRAVTRFQQDDCQATISAGAWVFPSNGGKLVFKGAFWFILTDTIGVGGLNQNVSARIKVRGARGVVLDREIGGYDRNCVGALGKGGTVCNPSEDAGDWDPPPSYGLRSERALKAYYTIRITVRARVTSWADAFGTAEVNAKEMSATYTSRR